MSAPTGVFSVPPVPGLPATHPLARDTGSMAEPPDPGVAAAASSRSEMPEARIKVERMDGSQMGRVDRDQPPPASRYGNLHRQGRIGPTPRPCPSDPEDDSDRRGLGRRDTSRGGLGRANNVWRACWGNFRPARINFHYYSQEHRDACEGLGHRKKNFGGGAGSSDDGSSDLKPEDYDAKKRHDREIDIKRKDDFTITCKSIRKARKCKKRFNMRFEVETFARCTEVNIKEWIVQMESYFDTSNFRPKAYVKFILQKIAHLYFMKAVVYIIMHYFDFRKKLIECSENLKWRLPDCSNCQSPAKMSAN